MMKYMQRGRISNNWLVIKTTICIFVLLLPAIEFTMTQLVTADGDGILNTSFTWEGRGNYLANGVGTWGSTSGTITIQNLTENSSVEVAFIYWACNSNLGIDPQISINSQGVTGMIIGQDGILATLRADITYLITGNGDYEVGNISNAYGASIVAVYSDPNLRYTMVLINDGQESNYGGSPPHWLDETTFSGFVASVEPEAKVTYILGDGQTYYQGAWRHDMYSFNGYTIATDDADGSDGNPTTHGWDTDTYNVSQYVTPGDMVANANVYEDNDELWWTACVFSITTAPPVLPPVADAGSDQTVNEGDVILFDGSDSYDYDTTIEIYEWDFESDGIFDYQENQTDPPDGDFDGKTMHIYGDNGVFTVTLRVTDESGANDTDICIVTVNNVAPTIDPFGPLIIEEGPPLDLTANAIDPGSDDLNFTWSWGDGTPVNTSIYYNDGIEPDLYPSSNGTFPFSKTDPVQHIYINYGIYKLNLSVEDDDGGIAVYSTNVTVISIFPPKLSINVSQDGNDIILYWEPISTLGIDHYLIYRATSQIRFDFNSIWINTSKDNETGEPSPIPLRTMWNDTNAALSNDDNYGEQYYYVIRMVNIFGSISRTSRTVGKWTKLFPKGVSTFSLPLEPIDTFYTDYYTTCMNANYIKYMDPINHTWRQHNLGDGNTNNTQMKLGEGYEVNFERQTNYTFTGMPAAMISYDDDSGFLGFDHLTEAGSLNLFVDPDGDVILVWDEPWGMSDGWYEVYYSNTRDGFFGELNTNYFIVDSPLDYGINSAFHSGACADDPGARLYYMVVPFNESGIKGASTYSIGIWTEEYWEGYDTFGIPLKLNCNQCADWFCDNIPNTVGINYYNVTFQEWWWHSTVMPKEAFDPLLEMTEGYQISTLNVTKFTFMGI